ncbi:alkaline phosphatase PhoX [Methylobacter sp. YRD-M1]|uniref:alkaline phosphatase PhoX n=1 Tax=Methylobacter sp. YRD-M1 TaxID=2911520 RepID=UPI00227D5A90|nr:alkaline phosphatase PhoX [Methylobacter sp. YRD-M1]WAK01210.1 PhoX family protein [Methylobacter sp. YRD-M1]
MKNKFLCTKLATAMGLLLTGTSVFADGTRFEDFKPLANSSDVTIDEAMPITLGNPNFIQRSIADRATQLADGKPNTGNWDMITTNETGRQNERFLFTVFETGQAGVQRHDLATGQTETVWISPAAGDHRSFDASFWTPWGTLITAEESWSTAAAGSTSPYGRLFELKNPLDAPGIIGPITADSNNGADFVHQNVIPRTSHEGIQFDKAGNLYFIDELNGGSVYKYTSAASLEDVKEGTADYFAAGTTYVLRVGDGNTPNATGEYEWVPFTDANGLGLPGALTITDTNGVISVDARNTTELPAFKGTDYQRPEDLQIQTVHGREFLYMTTTTTHEVYRLDLQANSISVFANRDSIDLATGMPVGSGLANPDNLAIDHDGNIYIIEDRNGGVDDDIWFAKDLNKDGDLNDEGEGLARWASNGTPGSEFTGLYFDPQDKRRAWVNIQHPASGNDRTIEITIADGKNAK